MTGAAMPGRLLLASDDAMLRASLKEQLEAQAEFQVAAVASAADGLRHARRRPIDLALLDAALPDMDGAALCRALRRSGCAAPVLLFGTFAPSDSPDAADGHIPKPFRFDMLLARIRAELRRRKPDEAAGLRLGAWRLRPGAKLLAADDGAAVRLTEKETAILHYLHGAGGRTVGRDELLREVWGYSQEAATRTLETHVWRLRRKLAAAGAGGLLFTEAGGYRLAGRQSP